MAEANCALSVRNFHEAVGVPSQLGLDPRAAFALDVAVNAGTCARRALLCRRVRAAPSLPLW